MPALRLKSKPTYTWVYYEQRHNEPTSYDCRSRQRRRRRRRQRNVNFDCVFLFCPQPIFHGIAWGTWSAPLKMAQSNCVTFSFLNWWIYWRCACNRRDEKKVKWKYFGLVLCVLSIRKLAKSSTVTMHLLLVARTILLSYYVGTLLRLASYCRVFEFWVALFSFCFSFLLCCTPARRHLFHTSTIYMSFVCVCVCCVSYCAESV